MFYLNSLTYLKYGLFNHAKMDIKFVFLSRQITLRNKFDQVRSYACLIFSTTFST